MIINFSIENFGSIKSKQTLSFEAEKSKHLEDFYITKIGKYRLLKIALIYGANASGKTMILQALDFLRNLAINPLRVKTDPLEFDPFLFDNDSSTKNTVLSIEFLQNQKKYLYEIEFNRKAVTEEKLYFFNPSKANVFTRITDLKKDFSEIKFGSKFKISKKTLENLQANTLSNNSVLGGYLKTNINIKELKDTTDWFRNTLYSFLNPKSDFSMITTSLMDEGKIKKQNVMTILKKADLNISDIIIDKKIENIPADSLEFLIEVSNIPINKLKALIRNDKLTLFKLDLEHLVDGAKYPLPFDKESEGTKRYYGLAGILNLLVSKSVIIPIDELEASLHPDLYQHFLLTFLANSKESQIIATTHNRELLNDKDIIRDDALWITNKGKDASTELYSFADFDSSIIRDTTNRLNAYKSGKLGGIPNISDFYLDLE